MNKSVLKPYITSSLKGTYWIGVVKSATDPKGASRVQVAIPRLTDKLPASDLPWYVTAQVFSSAGNAASTLPPVNSRVRLTFLEDDIYSGFVTDNIVSIPPA